MVIYYVKPEQLRKLKDGKLEYKYSGDDKSLFGKWFMQAWWRWVVQFVPGWLAPNAVTLIGFFFIISSYLISYYYTPLFSGSAPRWTYFFHTLSLFIYQTMDAVDGKHARNTGTSSPLGELFDHGCDALTTTLMMLTVGSTLQLGSEGWVVYFLLMFTVTVFYLAQAEQYQTGTLVLWYINVTEGQFAVMGIHLAAAIFGPDFWLQTTTVFGHTVSYNMLPGSIEITVAFLTACANLINIHAMTRVKGFWPVYGMLVPIVAALTFATLWAAYSPNHILRDHPQPFLLTIGFIFAFMVGRIVLSRLMQQNFSRFQPLVIPLAVGFVNAALNERLFPELLFLRIYLVVSMAAYTHFALYVIHVFTSALGINCLTIKPKGQGKSQ
eukprot:TRINITY_DN12244_c0_g1_i1.p1 TRINITY_DN12244_c0_g1~~TRINITY_DN12244_c0_g1_i1.p1  ORF type:complete len:401 (-),score=121.90 TRINITY_DN12244_c0_g1_i1:512-1657(-)